MVRFSDSGRSGFVGISCVEFFDEFTGMDVRGRFPGVSIVVVMAPLDEVVDAPPLALGIEDSFDLIDVIAINVGWYKLGLVLEDGSVVGRDVGFMEDIVFSLALPCDRNV